MYSSEINRQSLKPLPIRDIYCSANLSAALEKGFCSKQHQSVQTVEVPNQTKPKQTPPPTPKQNRKISFSTQLIQMLRTILFCTCHHCLVLYAACENKEGTQLPFIFMVCAILSISQCSFMVPSHTAAFPHTASQANHNWKKTQLQKIPVQKHNTLSISQP